MKELASSLLRVLRRPRAVALSWAVRMLFSLLLALPLWQLVVGSGMADHPDGDAILFRDGGLHLAELVRLTLPELHALARSAPGLFVVLGLVSLLPLAALFVSLDSDERLSTRAWIGDAAACLPRFTFVAGFCLLVQALLSFVTLTVAVQVREAVADPTTPRSADAWGVGIALFGFFLVALIGVLADLARAAIVRRDARALEALGIAINALTRRPFATLSSWATPGAWSLVFVLTAAWIVGRVDVSHGGLGRIATVAVVHQLTLVALIVLRGAWLNRALILTDHA
ncbi:MAG: hypothetical protein KC776_12590 [Myxococcales bacterium]|nr:hypothetical protein [Myxococcales bacterium]MCB9577268.1 hypothetical protein [Polyangiaceae bacterium]